MKKIITFTVLLMLLLSGCGGPSTNSEDGDNSGKPSDNTNQTQEENAEDNQNSNFKQFKDAPDDAIALMVNRPTSEQRSLLEIPEILYLQDTEEKIIFIPRYEHTTVELYTVDDIDEAGNISSSEFYINKDCGKDFALELQAIRPEGLPNYKLIIRLPDGVEKEYFISYNGKDGNPNLEYILSK